MSTFENDIKDSLRKHGEETMCPFCGWSLLEKEHNLEECERINAELNARDD